ncbi:hypothetical protein [Pseudomonas sp. 2(2015)]|uniref:hypothetical protein n=1 Tax=Pseudomonas sp. 2(2015) TaxID=1619950 RepID=UPI0012E07CEB|nr:hypothetical protein [Pseudomonas sp. 2(2015)]
MQFTYESKSGMYIYRGPNGHSGIAYSLEQVNERLTKTYGEDGYSLTPATDTASTTSA